MPIDFNQISADAALEADCRELVRLAIDEDFGQAVDWTTAAIVPESRSGVCDVVARESGVCAGLVSLPWIVDAMGFGLAVELQVGDGDAVAPLQSVARISGSAREILSSERIILNTLCRMFGIASFTKQFVNRIEGTGARLYDTRKTTLGWRRMDKYAVRCGGGNNHRLGLFDAFLIKDNHLALAGGDRPLSPSEAVSRARQFRSDDRTVSSPPAIVEIEVDTLEQFADVLPAHPDIVLLDNFLPDQLCEAVALRDRSATDVQLEASGNVSLDTIAQIATSGVDRISSGALTHAARWLDLGLDWKSG